MILDRLQAQMQQPVPRLFAPVSQKFQSEVNPQVVLGYHWTTKPLVHALYDALTGAGVVSWMDEKHLGDKIEESEYQALQQASVFLAIVSVGFYKSTSCRRMVEIAESLHKRVIFVQGEHGEGWYCGWLKRAMNQNRVFAIPHKDHIPSQLPSLVQLIKPGTELIYVLNSLTNTIHEMSSELEGLKEEVSRLKRIRHMS